NPARRTRTGRWGRGREPAGADQRAGTNRRGSASGDQPAAISNAGRPRRVSVTGGHQQRGPTKADQRARASRDRRLRPAHTAASTAVWVSTTAGPGAMSRYQDAYSPGTAQPAPSPAASGSIRSNRSVISRAVAGGITTAAATSSTPSTRIDATTPAV